MLSNGLGMLPESSGMLPKGLGMLPNASGMLPEVSGVQVFFDSLQQNAFFTAHLQKYMFVKCRWKVNVKEYPFYFPLINVSSI
jgi:hypothetical protein